MNVENGFRMRIQLKSSCSSVLLLMFGIIIHRNCMLTPSFKGY